MKRVAVLSDIHCNILSLNLAIKDAEKNGVDYFIFLGDYVTDGIWNNEILEIIRSKANAIILGNREKYILNYNPLKKDNNGYKNIAYAYEDLNKDNLEYIKSLNEVEIIELDGKKVLLIHGDVYSEDNIDKNIENSFDSIIDKYDFDICLFGHTHVHLYKEYRNKIFVNPGSIGRPCDYPTYKYCILDISEKVNLELREFRVEDTYNQLLDSYMDTKYYKDNKVWAELTLRGIRDGRSCYWNFFKLLNSKLGSNDTSSSHYNKVWNDTYIEFCNIYGKLL